jgi:hypothetical protein
MKLSLIQITEEKANRNHIKIGIVEQVSTTVPQLAGIFHNLVKLI